MASQIKCFILHTTRNLKIQLSIQVHFKLINSISFKISKRFPRYLSVIMSSQFHRAIINYEECFGRRPFSSMGCTSLMYVLCNSPPVIKCQFINTQTLIIPRAFPARACSSSSPSITVPNEPPYRQSAEAPGPFTLIFHADYDSHLNPRKTIRVQI